MWTNISENSYYLLCLKFDELSKEFSKLTAHLLTIPLFKYTGNLVFSRYLCIDSLACINNKSLIEGKTLPAPG